MHGTQLIYLVPNKSWYLAGPAQPPLLLGPPPATLRNRPVELPQMGKRGPGGLHVSQFMYLPPVVRTFNS